MGRTDPSKRGGPATRSQGVGSGPVGCGRWVTTLPRGTGGRRLSPKRLLGKRTHEELQQRGVEGAGLLRFVAPVSEGPGPRRQQIPPGDRRRCARPPQHRGEPAARGDQHDRAELQRRSLPPHRPAGSPWPGPAPSALCRMQSQHSQRCRCGSGSRTGVPESVTVPSLLRNCERNHCSFGCPTFL